LEEPDTEAVISLVLLGGSGLLRSRLFLLVQNP
jgi:hypothetical protein